MRVLAGRLPPREGVMSDDKVRDALADEHARYHDMPGNLYGPDECGWERCDFFAVANHILASDVLATIKADAQREALLAAADAIQALHPGEVKASVTFLRDRAEAPA